MKQLLEFIPLAIFFIFYKMYDIFSATKALMIATALAVLISWLWQRKLDKMALFTFFMVEIFGALTLIFHNDEFIKWKVTIIYVLFGLVLMASQWFMEKPLIQKMLGKELVLPEMCWRRLNTAWAIFFVCCGLLNIYFAFWLSQSTWVNFKTFGLTLLTLLFILTSGLYIWRYLSTKNK